MIKKILKKILKLKPITLSSEYIEETKILKNKNVLVFGGSRGIGLSISKGLKSEGANVLVLSRAEHLEKEEFHFVQSAVKEFDKYDEILQEVIERMPKIDIVINCHGICPQKDFKGDFLEINFEDFDEVIDVNLKSVYFINLYFCKYFLKNKIKGHILNICSTDGLKGSCVPYGISKNGCVALTKGLGKKMAEYGIIINGIAPGGTATSMIKRNENDLRSNIPSNRLTTTEEIANMALFLVSDMGNNMIGEIVVIDGGESLK